MLVWPFEDELIVQFCLENAYEMCTLCKTIHCLLWYAAGELSLKTELLINS